MEQSLTTLTAAADQAASTETDQTAPLGHAGAAGRRLERRQIAAVRPLVASAASALSPERVTPADDHGRLRARGKRASEG